MRKQKIFLEVACTLLWIMFLFAAIIKYTRQSQFTPGINNQPLDNSWTPYLQNGLPALEIIIALMLIFDRTRRPGLWLYTGLAATYTGYNAAIVLGLFDRVPCSCGGIFPRMTWNQHLVFVTCIFLMAAATLVMHYRVRAYDKMRLSLSA